MRRPSVLLAAVSASLVLGAAVLATLSGCGDAASLGPFVGANAHRHATRIVELSPRPPGSEGIRNVADYIEQQLAAISPDLKLQRQSFFRADLDEALGHSLEFQNLWVEIPGTRGGELPPILAIAAHYDSKITHPGEQDFEFVGALDSAGSCGVLIELARLLQAQPPIGPDVWLIWFDGEESIPWEWDHGKSLMGSRHFAQVMNEDGDRFPTGLRGRLKVLVLLDLLGDPELKIDKDTASNPTLNAIFKDAATRLGRADVMFRYESPMTDDHIPFKEKGVSVIDLIDFRYRPAAEHSPSEPAEVARYFPWWHTAEDNLQHLSADSLELVGNLVWAALPDIEKAFYK
ncbi:MAG: M28 family peptidase [Planctomycetes bacterium]|nr:M28 family peptidase [Planctomycetota bacterium]